MKTMTLFIRKYQLTNFIIVFSVLSLVVGGSLYYYQSALAAVELTISPLTWNVVGLDSNDPENSGPENFPVGVRVCNTGDEGDTAHNVTVQLVWDSNNAYVGLRSGSLGYVDHDTTSPVEIGNLAGGNTCQDVYFEVTITRTSDAFDTTRRYHIVVDSDETAEVSTPTPRELYVEHLISQNRNSTTDVLLDGQSIPAGGTMALMVGGTYNIQLVGSTATNGYEQIENFINFPNTIFQINSVTTTYSAYPTPHTDPDWDNKLYADGCGWENDTNSPNYRSCLSVGKYGGRVTVTYSATIISGAGTTQTLNNLIYDFSGSSYHYNSDYEVGGRIAAIIDPATATIGKNFTPSTTGTGGVSTLTFTLSNPNGAPLTDVNFSDTFPTSPGAMVVTSPAVYSTSGCGTPTFAPTAGAASISFSDGIIPANGACIINVNVSVPTAGTYDNTSDNLFIGTLDTGKNANASLKSITDPVPTTCTPNVELARWEFNDTTLDATFQSSQVITATASYTGGGTSVIKTFGNPANSWSVTSGWAINATGYPNAGASPYFEITLDTSQTSDVSIAYDFDADGNWADSRNNAIYTYSNADGGIFTDIYSTTFARNDSFTSIGPLSAVATGSDMTTFRINAVGQQQETAEIFLDNIVIRGCGVPQLPTLTKSFSPGLIPVNGQSTLTFNLTNENEVALTGVRFTDELPAGLQVAAIPNAGTTCGGTPTWNPTAGATTLTFGSPAGATIPPRVGGINGSCAAQVDVTADTSGPHQNVSGFIYAAETYTNTGTTGSASASLTAVLPPQISKRFAPNPIVAGGTSTVTLTIVNPNPDDELTGVAFTDNFPAAMVVADPTGAETSGCGTPTFTAVSGTGTITFSDGTIAAAGTCTVKVNITAATTGNHVNVTGSVSADTAGEGNTASDTLTVTDVHPGISILKQVSTDSQEPWTSFVSVPEGGDIYYQFTVENTGDVALSSVNVTDSLLVPAPPNAVTGCSWASMPLYDLQTCTFGPVTAASGWYSNTATASGIYNTTTYTDTSTASYATTDLTLVKSVSESAYTGEGDMLHYTFVVTNTGSAPLAAPVTIDDDLSSDENCPAVSTVGDNDNWFDPGESITCSATYTVVAGDVGAGNEVTNIASATVDGVSSNTDTETVPWTAADYGDLPDTYNNTLLAEDGARHTSGNLYLGPSVDVDLDGQESSTSSGDTGDDGIVRTPGVSWPVGTGDGSIDVTTSAGCTQSAPCYLSAWINWNRTTDADFDDAGERILLDYPVYGTQTITFTIPGTVPFGVTVDARFRLYATSTNALAQPKGLANNGEVEDYTWELNPTVVTLQDFSAENTGIVVSAWIMVAGIVLVSVPVVIKLRRRKT